MRFQEPEAHIKFNSINESKNFTDSCISGGSVAFDCVAYGVQVPRNSVTNLYLHLIHCCSLRAYLRFYGSFKRVVSIPGCTVSIK